MADDSGVLRRWSRIVARIALLFATQADKNLKAAPVYKTS